MNNFPKGNDLIVKWAIKYSDGTPFPLENYAWELCYSAGRGINVVKDTAVISASDNLLTWRFSGKDQAFYGKYSLTLRLYQQGKIVATVRKNNAFELSTTQYDGPCDIDLVSYCDNISLQDALLRGNRAMEVAQDAKAIAGSAVNTAGDAATTANQAKTIASTANNTSTEAKTIASNAKTVADQAKVTADATAATATQKAEEVAQKEAQLEAALNNLSTDQSGALALSTKVNEHGEKLSELEREIYYDNSELIYDRTYTKVGLQSFICNFIKEQKYKIQVKLTASAGNLQFGTLTSAGGNWIDSSELFKNVSEAEFEFIASANSGYVAVYQTGNGSVELRVYKIGDDGNRISDLESGLNELRETTNQNTSDIDAIKSKLTANGWTLSLSTIQEGSGLTSIPFSFVKDKKYKVVFVGSRSIATLQIGTLATTSSSWTDSTPAMNNVDSYTWEFIASTNTGYIGIYANGASMTRDVKIYEYESLEVFDVLNSKIGLVDSYDASKLKRNCGVVAFIFDDSLPYQDTSYGLDTKWVVEAFKERGLIFTIALSNIVEHSLDLSKYRAFLADGHGIISHSKNHPTLTNKTDAEIKAECVDTLNWLRGGNLPCRGFVYPNNAHNANVESIVSQYYGYAFGERTKSTHITPNDEKYKLSRFGAVEEMAFEQVKGAIDECISSRGLLVLWGHAYRIGYTGSQWTFITKDVFLQMLDYLAEKVASYDVEMTTVDKAMDMYFL